MKFGQFKIQSISGGRFRLDGGAMFGVVPKTLWSSKSPADEYNRIQLDTNCLLIQGPGITAICDTGFGTKLSDKERTHIDAVRSDSLVHNLAEAGVAPGDITHVLFSHLHFDHAGGATRQANHGGLELTFPNATYVVQKEELEDATSGAFELEGNYYEEIEHIADSKQVMPVTGECELFPGIKLIPTGGHTRGHQCIEIEGDDRRGIYLGDLCPTSEHLRIFWTMAYDSFQLDVRRSKRRLLSQFAEAGDIVFFDHDPTVRAATLRKKNNKAFEIAEVIDLNS